MKTRSVVAMLMFCAGLLVNARPVTAQSFQWGTAGDVPLVGDFDGDGINDLTIYRPSNGTWYIRYSSLGFSLANSIAIQWGTTGDIPVVGDFDGDTRADIVVFRPVGGIWYVRLSTTGYNTAVSYQWGTVGDIPSAGDYNGDGTTDIAVFRPSAGVWFIRPSPAPPALFTRTGTGANVFDMPTNVTRVRIVGDYSGSCENFIIRIAGKGVVNEILGSCSIGIGSHFDGTFLTTGGVVEVLNSNGISWSFTEVR